MSVCLDLIGERQILQMSNRILTVAEVFRHSDILNDQIRTSDWSVCVTWCEYCVLIGRFVSRGVNTAF